MVETAITVVGAAIAYSLTVFFFGKQTKPDGPEPFNVRKFVRSLIIGLILGVVALQTGIELNLDNVEHLATSYGVVGLADQITKAIFRNLDVDRGGRWLSKAVTDILNYGR